MASRKASGRVPRARGGREVRLEIRGTEGIKAFLTSLGYEGAFTTGGGRNSFPDTDRLVDPYRQEPRIFSAINLFADTAMIPPLRVYTKDPRVDPDAAKVVEGTDLNKLLDQVNPLIDGPDLASEDATNMELTGESFWALTDKAGAPVRSYGLGGDALIDTPAHIWPVRGDVVELEKDQQTGMVRAWKMPHTNGSTVPFPPACVVQHKYRNPADPFRGIGPVAAAAGLAAQNYLALRYQNALLLGGGDMGGVLAVEGILSPETFKRLQEQLRERQRQIRPGEIAIIDDLGSKAEYTQTPVGTKVMSYADLLKANRQWIAEIFRVPAALLGDQAENYATFKGHLRVFWTLKVLPWLAMREEKIQRHLVKRLRDRKLSELFVRHDVSMVEALQGETLEQAQAAQALILVGVPPNAAVKHVGIRLKTPIEGGDVSLIGGGLQPLADLSMPDEPADGVDGAQPVEGAAPAQPAGAASVADTALNGAQTAELVNILTQVAQGVMPKESAIAIIRAAFPSIDEAEAHRIIDPVEVAPAAPEPAATPSAPPPPPPPSESAKAALRSEHAAGRLRLDADAVARLAVRTTRDKYASPEERRLRSASTQRRRAKLEKPLLSKVRAYYMKQRKAQLRTLSSKAATGKPPEKGVPRAPLPPIEPPAWCGRAQAAALARCRTDAALRRWRARWHWTAARGGLDLHELAMLAFELRSKIPRKELRELILARQQIWIDDLFDNTAAQLALTWDAEALIAANEIGVPVIASTDPSAVDFLRAKGVALAEGTNSTVAQRVEAAIVKALEENASGGSLADQIREALEEVEAAVKRVYNATHSRAVAIARTEVAQVSGASTDAEFKKGKAEGLFKRHRWVTSGQGPESGGGTVRESHWELDGTVHEIGKWIRTINGNELRYACDPGCRGPTPASELVNCFPSGAPIAGRFLRGIRSAYEGPLREVRLASGKILRATPNHPVLTPIGMVPIGALGPGDQVIGDRVEADLWRARVPQVDERHAPPAVDQAFELLAKRGAARRRHLAPHDLHGDARSVMGEVDVVSLEGGLLLEAQPASRERGAQLRLVSHDVGAASGARSRASFERSSPIALAAACAPRAGELASDRGAVGVLAPPQPALLGDRAGLLAVLRELSRERGPADTSFARELLDRVPALVTTDEVLEVRDVDLRGHVFDFQSDSGLLIAGGIIASNCGCSMVPVEDDETE